MTANNLGIITLVNSISDWQTWVVLVIVSVFGLLGGLAHKLLSPPKDKTSLSSYIIVGILTSLAILFIFMPTDAVRLIALSIIAGYGGKSILDALEAKVQLAIAQTEVTKTKEIASKEVAKTKELALKAIDTATEFKNYAQNFAQSNQILIQANDQNKSLERPIPAGMNLFEVKTPEMITDEFSKLSGKLDFIKESLL